MLQEGDIRSATAAPMLSCRLTFMDLLDVHIGCTADDCKVDRYG